MTASKLGATVGVSESTVVRFAARRLGYCRLSPALQQAMQEAGPQQDDHRVQRIGGALRARIDRSEELLEARGGPTISPMCSQHARTMLAP